MEDILEELNIRSTGSTKGTGSTGSMPNLTPEEMNIIKILSDRQMHIDEVVRASGLTTSGVAATITILEMKHVIRDYGEKIYGLCN